jgi:hypothetical protein
MTGAGASRKAPKITEVLPLLYPHGLSSDEKGTATPCLVLAWFGCPARR